MNDLRTAAQAVLDRWDSPAWEWVKQGPTAALMADLRAALAQEQAEPVVRGAAYADALRSAIKACGAVQRDDGVWFGDDAAVKLARVLSEGIAPPRRTMVPLTDEEIERIRADEREACAKECEEVDANPHIVLHHAVVCAAAIRARSKA